MSEKKIGRWFYADKDGVLYECFNREDAYRYAKNRDISNFPDAPHRVIYMQETDPPKEEEECPELEPGDVVWSTAFFYALMVTDPLRLAGVELCPGQETKKINVNGVAIIYRRGRKIWWKGKCKGES